MGKKNKHSKDKLHKTVTELTSHHVDNRELELSNLHRRLKFDSCCLSLNTITDKPVGLCDGNGFCYTFECDLLLKFLDKYKVHPITGETLTTKLIELNYHKNNDGHYYCPVTYKLFNAHSKIVVNRKTGNVFSYEAYQQLNLKENNFKDFLTDEPFDKEDILLIQDPDKATEKWSVSEFYYVKNKLKLDDDFTHSNLRNVNQSEVLKSSLEEYKQNERNIVETFHKIVGKEASKEDQVKLDKVNSANQSDGALSKSVTSTVMPIVSHQKAALLNEDEILYPRVKKKGYLQLVTNFGPLNLELYCDRAPKTCHNFFLLASRSYYDNTCFHRLVKNFILQGGDPTSTGSGGESAWGPPFKNECFADLKHNGRGVLAMANSGPNTNKSQFYITLKGSWAHLDGKHTVFGRVVGGDETLDKIESVETDKNDKPKTEIRIERVIKYVDPFEEAAKKIEEERKGELEMKKKLLGKTPKEPLQQPLKKFRPGIGTYINLDALNNKSSSSAVNCSNANDLQVKDTKANGNSLTRNRYGDFSNW